MEVLIALEPLRIVLTWSTSETWKRRLVRLAPFYLVIAAVVILRLTILGKSGHYAGQYGFMYDLSVIRNSLLEHLRAFPEGLSYAASHGTALLGHSVRTALTLVAIAGFALLSSRALWTPWVLEGRGSIRRVLVLLLLGAAIALLGAMPFALTGTYGAMTRGESRLLFASQVRHTDIGGYHCTNDSDVAPPRRYRGRTDRDLRTGDGARFKMAAV
ncbi:hypothetical protein AOQ72_34270 [Bradyrhizobium yuanmingense]|uniref:Uncharacterized protein n=1 Tax=Bradyrhizobium yuanmingense TaxID=108015 RepID=A0A0R3BZJ0_9BRAD|nr:hypothetical protein AOQ72_34270 [Bradyrhizobium yuanmingense]